MVQLDEKTRMDFGIAEEDLKSLEGNLFVVKAGGDVLDGTNTIAEELALLQKYGAKVVFVYGAQAEISRKMQEYGLKPRFANGLRLTDAETMENVYIPVMRERGIFLADSIPNSELVVGGIHANKIGALGYVGEAAHVDDEIRKIIDSGKVAIVSPLAKSAKAWEGYGLDEYLNCNADNVASRLAIYFKPAAPGGLYLATNVPGVMVNGAVQKTISPSEAKILAADGIVTEGMAQKVINAVQAVEKSSGIAVIFDGRQPYNLLRAVHGLEGTLIQGNQLSHK